MLSDKRFALLLAGLIVILGAYGAPLAAQDNPDVDLPADSQLAGTAHTADGTAIPGATLRVTQTSTGKAWVTWTDEDGKFEFPALPEGHFRAEISQLGFSSTKKKSNLISGFNPPFYLKMDVSTRAAIAALPTTESVSKTPG